MRLCGLAFFVLLCATARADNSALSSWSYQPERVAAWPRRQRVRARRQSRRQPLVKKSTTEPHLVLDEGISHLNNPFEMKK